MPTYYVFVDTNNGVATPANDTPDTSTSKYQTRGDYWPATTARWLSLATAVANTVLRGVVGDFVFQCTGTVDDSPVNIGTGLTNWSSIRIIGDCGATEDTSDYTLNSGTGVGYCLQVSSYNGPVFLEKLRFYHRGVSVVGYAGVYCYSTGANVQLHVDSCFVRVNSAYTTSSAGIHVTVAVPFTIKNSVIRAEGSSSSQRNGVRGISTTANTMILANCTISNFTGSTDIAAVWPKTIINTAVVNCTSVTSGTIVTNSNNATRTGTGSNPVTIADNAWDPQLNDYPANDYRPLSTSSLLSAGLGPSANADVPTTDISGRPRSGATANIGPYEYYAPVRPFTLITTTG